MPWLAERVYFHLCFALGWLLRRGRYSDVRVAGTQGTPRVRKRRRVYAPLLVRASERVFGLLDTGMRVLRQAEWEERERRLYEILGRDPVQLDDGALILPRLGGSTLAHLLGDPAVNPGDRLAAIRLAVIALAELHRAGFTHGDAMAENVLVDLESGAAHWFDFETDHDLDRPLAWRRADDLRALLATSLVPLPDQAVREALTALVDAYPDEAARHLLATCFTPIVRRPLAFHLGQAPLPFSRFRLIATLLSERSVPPRPTIARGDDRPPLER